ncbi:gamma-glutamyl-gamma-aminobutyrate hydrolase family protein [Olsenella uli]|uniref:gamma-glutamyl-gamma-aminobutyrate hydrolase family protein n=1 Tax=Olsenella uli TaxID=133926 RepID=UPI00195B980E|nr:gamma-glutamyl-gamma-aminobutyrate hydrolase family protein [Olsenella uli]MBM6816403.1 gamma-glutamyl-gamma-aminobutyrate hydrolase family protein [Olsenella uli]
MARRPVVLMAPRWVPESRAGLERMAPQEAIADCFVDAILAAGGLPLVMSLTEDEGVIDSYLELADGIAVPGGPDVNPRRWGSDMDYDPALLCEQRDAFEFPLVVRALAADLPLLTTCRGTQLLNVALGGTLCMDVPSLGAPEGMAQWRHEGILNDPAHPVEVEPESLLSRALGGVTSAQVNSAHHCCVDRLGEGVRLVARATDGVPEAIEVPGRRFCVGVQWHPEYTWRTLPTDRALWRSFVDACR